MMTKMHLIEKTIALSVVERAIVLLFLNRTTAVLLNFVGHFNLFFATNGFAFQIFFVVFLNFSS